MNQQIFANALWSILGLLFVLILAVLVLGFTVGLFTYGKRGKSRRGSRDVLLDDVLEIGMSLSHLFIDWIKGRSSKTGDWLNDQQLLAMLRGMSPTEFEEFIARVFEALGYKTKLMGGAGDGGVDIAMMKGGRHFLVQCKKFITQKVTPHDVRDFYGAMGNHHIDGKGFFVTTNIFTFDAEQFAEGKAMELIDSNRLVELVRQAGIMNFVPAQSKQPPAEQGASCPQCGGSLVLRTNKENNNRFWGCSNFPKCRFTKPF